MPTILELADELVLEAAFKLEAKYKFQGLPICIENKKGSVRSGTQTDGSKWSVTMPFDYGYVDGTKGVDGDEVDVFIGPNKKATHVFIVHQKKYGTKDTYDEDKCMLGWDSADAAKKAYHSAYKNCDLFLSMTMMSLDAFKKRVKQKIAGKIHALCAGGPGSGRHKTTLNVDDKKLKHDKFLEDQRNKVNKLRERARKQGTSARGKPVISEKAKLALATANPATKVHHDLAEVTEHTIHKSMPGSHKSKNNSPFDIVHGKHGIEVKSLMYQKNDKITQNSDAIQRKTDYAKKNGIKQMHTVAVDYRGGGKPIVYHKEGVGSFRIGSMTKVKGGFKGLKDIFK
jgi:hypothetical protein